jgi:CRISPR-associated endonuclease/helicase Cas3
VESGADGGKRLALLGFALVHACRDGLSRIVYATLFTSIVDQTSDIVRQLLGDDGRPSRRGVELGTP